MSLVKHLHPPDQNPKRTRKVELEKLYESKLSFYDIEFPVKVKDIHKIERKPLISISVFGYEDKGKYPIFKTISNVVKVNMLIYF